MSKKDLSQKEVSKFRMVFDYGGEKDLKHITGNFQKNSWNNSYQIKYFVVEIYKQILDDSINDFFKIPFIFSDGINIEESRFIEVKEKSEEDINIPKDIKVLLDLIGSEFGDNLVKLDFINPSVDKKINKKYKSGNIEIDYEINLVGFKGERDSSYKDIKKSVEYEKIKTFLNHYFRFLSVEFYLWWKKKYFVKKDMVDRKSFFEILEEFMRYSSELGYLRKDNYVKNIDSLENENSIHEIISKIYDDFFKLHNNFELSEDDYEFFIKKSFSGIINFMISRSFNKTPLIEKEYEITKKLLITSSKCVWYDELLYDIKRRYNQSIIDNCFTIDVYKKIKEVIINDKKINLN